MRPLLRLISVPRARKVNRPLFPYSDMPFGPQGQEARYDPRQDFLSKRVEELIEENRELKEDKKSFRNASNQYQTELAKAKDEIEQMRKELRVKEDEIQNLKRSMGEPQVRASMFVVEPSCLTMSAIFRNRRLVNKVTETGLRTTNPSPQTRKRGRKQVGIAMRHSPNKPSLAPQRS